MKLVSYRSFQKSNLKLAIIFFNLLFLNDLKCYSQELCGTDAFHQKLLQNDTTYRTRFFLLEDELDTKIQNTMFQEQNVRTAEEVYTIPVVVHIIHLGEQYGTGSNISDNQIIEAIEGVNDRFANSIGTSLDIEIRFALANRDPYGCPTNGINRVNGSSILNYTSEGITLDGSCGADNISIKDLSRWPTLDYYNIWVVHDICGSIAGYANYPTFWEYEGTVIRSNIMTYQSTVLTHEIGHGLFLYHTFQGDEDGEICPVDNDCTVDGDRLCDTPPHKRSDCGSTNPCSSTGIWDNSRYNNMSYCASKSRFTQGQKDRMRVILQINPRLSLLYSDALILSDFGTTISKSNSSYNLCDGAITVTPSCPSSYSYNWSNGATTSTISNLCPGPYSVTITDAFDNSLSLNIEIEIVHLAVSPTNHDVDPESGSTTFNITSNINWSISDDADWLIINPTNGTNNAILTATYNENTTTSSRMATITISGQLASSQSVTVTQAAYGIHYSISGYVQTEYGDGISNVYLSYGSAVSLDQSQEEINYGFWIDEGFERWQEFVPTETSLCQLDFYIHKRGIPGDLIIKIKNFSGTRLWSSPIPMSFISEGVSWVSINISPVLDIIPGNSYFIYITSSIPSSDPDNRYFWMGHTESNYDRGISGVEQWWQGYDYAFRTWSGTGSFKITSNDGFYFFLVNPGWSDTIVPSKESVVFTPGTKNFVDVQSNYTNQNFTGNNAVLSISPNNHNVSSDAGDTTFNITSNISWEVSDDAEWLALNPTSGNNDETITATFPENTSTNSRTATITVSGSGISPQTATVMQAGCIVPSQPSPITGSTSVCVGDTESYSVTNISGITYSWEATGGTVSENENGNSVSVIWNSSGNQTLTATPSNSCGDGPPRELTVTVSDTPSQPSEITGNTSVCVGDGETYSVTDVSGITYLWEVTGGSVSASGSSANVIWNSAGNQTITVTPSNSCRSGPERELSVIVNPPPSQIEAEPVNSSICVGDIAEIAFSGLEDNVEYMLIDAQSLEEVFTFSNDGAPDLTHSIEGLELDITFNIEAVNTETGCEISMTAMPSINVIPLPLAIIEQNSDATLVASQGDTYQWFFNGETLSGATFQTFDPDLKGSYFVEVTENGCTAISEMFEVIVVGIEDDLNDHIFIYPNPVRDYLIIDWDNFNYATLMSLSGQQIIDKASKILNLSTLKNGAYILILHGKNDQVIQYKIIKE